MTNQLDVQHIFLSLSCQGCESVELVCLNYSQKEPLLAGKAVIHKVWAGFPNLCFTRLDSLLKKAFILQDVSILHAFLRYHQWNFFEEGVGLLLGTD